MIAAIRRRPDPLLIIVAATVAEIGTALLGVAGRIALWALEIPGRHEPEGED